MTHATPDTAPGTLIEIDKHGSGRWTKATVVGPDVKNTASLVVKECEVEYRVHWAYTRLIGVSKVG